MADGLEARIIGALRTRPGASHRVGPVTDSTMSEQPPEIPGAGPDTTTIYMTLDEVNAWLATRAHVWSTHQGYRVPESVSDPMVTVVNDRLVFAFRYNSYGFAQVFSTTVDPEFRGNGRARIHLVNTRAGKLPIPARGIAGYVEHHMGNDAWARKMASWLDELPDHDVQLKFKTDEKRRRIYIMGYAVREGGIYMAMKLDGRDHNGRGMPTLVTADGE
jgi:hypothetical protein